MDNSLKGSKMVPKTAKTPMGLCGFAFRGAFAAVVDQCAILNLAMDEWMIRWYEWRA